MGRSVCLGPPKAVQGKQSAKVIQIEISNSSCQKVGWWVGLTFLIYFFFFYNYVVLDLFTLL